MFMMIFLSYSVSLCFNLHYYDKVMYGDLMILEHNEKAL